MARVSYLEQQDLPEEMRWLYDNLGKGAGGASNIFKAAAHNARVLRGMMVMGTAILEKSKLDPKLRELAILRVGKLCNSQYEQAQHFVIGRQTGLTEPEMAALADWSQSSLFGDKEKAVLQYTDEVTKQVEASETTYAALGKFFDQQETVELTLTIGYYNMICRFLINMKVDLEPGVKPTL